MIAAVNLALFSGYCRTEREQTSAEREKIQQETEEYLNRGYSSYLEYIQTQSQAQSVLQKLSRNKTQRDYIARNLEKTVQDYQALGSVTLQSGENRGILAVMHFDLTDFLLLLAPILLVMEIAADSNTAVGALIRSTKRGRVPLTAWRMLAVVIYAAADILLLYGGNLLFASSIYGNPVLHRAVQSLPEFQSCPYRLSVGGYFLCAALLKLLAVTVIALLAWLLLARMHPILGWGIFAGILGGMYLLNTLILPTAKLNHLKYINLFAALEADTFFTNYLNLNWFSHPSGFTADMLLGCLLMLGIVTVLVLWRVGKCRPVQIGARLEALRNALTKRLNRFLPVHTRFGFEGKKLLFAQRGWLVLLAAGILGVRLWQDLRVLAPERDTDAIGVYRIYNGEITPQKLQRADAQRELLLERIQNAEERIADLQKNKSEDSSLQGIYESDLRRFRQQFTLYDNLCKTMHRNADYTAETGRPTWLVYEEDYQLLFQETAGERRCCMILLLVLIFLFCSMEAYDNRAGLRMLLRSTKHGRGGLCLQKLLWTALLTALLSVGLHGIYLLHLNKDVGFSMLHAPAQSLAGLQWLPFSVSLRTALIGFMVLRVLAAFAVSCGILAISRISSTPQKALILASTVFLMPAALAESGVKLFQMFDFVRFLSCCSS